MSSFLLSLWLSSEMSFDQSTFTSWAVTLYLWPLYPLRYRSLANQMPNATPVSGSTLSLSPSHRSLTLPTSSLSSGSTLKLLWGSALAGLGLCHIVLQRTRFNCRPFQAFQATGAAPRRGDCFPFPWHFQLAANSLLSAHNHILHIYCTYIAYISHICIWHIYLFVCGR